MTMISPYAYVGIKHKPLGMICRTKDDIEAIVNTVCRSFNVKKEALIQKTRKRHIVEPRQIICYLIRKNLPNVSLVKVGEYFGGQDHTTILHSVNTVQNLMATDADYKHRIFTIESEI